ncbi:polyprenyl diphosphate synthase [Parasphaerochaeta coccoides]|uniref:Isoprenyl transferase n=1 Tax=Parasphaerochaeta coccoides (strain ATCC BAA-1237 / DSM 17374 / SPN1) TaxID=760011 RepID=F4GLE9_PARC1|nr:polyprenyl diphosphate synthase [Parasphaerochaeta coccoides]AEC01919.1 Undecaprenyl pyrophosphate synthetase [Parasphaerochaeta coccoides DSM 17374]
MLDTTVSSIIPTHVGFIMDGNGRWAQKRALPRVAGHLEGLKACRRVIIAAAKQGIRYVTLYVFSTENWKRPAQEVSYLMGMLVSKIHGELNFYRTHDIRILVRGDISQLPQASREALEATIRETASAKGMTCVLAINYGGRDEIVRSIRDCLKTGRISCPEDVTEELISTSLTLPSVPDPDIVVRSAGEKRLSNFLLWQIAYAELAFYDKLWPDWDSEDVKKLCDDFASRTRRYGGLSV